MNNITLDIFFESGITLLALIGFGLASYIYAHKKANKRLICPLHSNCETVIHSDYAHFLGIPVEALGMIYYIFTAAFHFLLITLPLIISPSILLFALILSIAAFLFSLYLISVQVFILKQICTWCLLSATICTLIFLITFLASHTTIGLIMAK